MTFDMSSLLENNLFLSMLSQGGASLAGEGSVAAGINPILQGTIAAQSKAKEQQRQQALLAKLLGEGVDFRSGADGKVKINADNMEAFSSLLGDSGGSELSIPGAADQRKDIMSMQAPAAPTQPQTQSQGGLDTNILKSLLNPTSSPSDVPAYSDLVGLTPQDMQQALAGAQQTELLKQKIKDNLAARQAQQRQLDISERQAETSELTAKTNLFKAMTKDERTAAQKNYEFAKEEGFPGSFIDFQNTAKTTHQKDFEAAKADGYEGSFNEWMLDMAKAGAITIGELTSREMAKGDIAGQLYFKKGEFIKDLNKHMSSDEVQNKLFATDLSQRDIESAKEKVIFIEQNIISRGGEITDIRFAKDGKTMVWTVTWPTGDTEEINHGVRD